MNQVSYRQTGIIKYHYITSIIHRLHPLSELNVLGKTMHLIIR